MNQPEICKVPSFIEFQYRNEQQMHCTVEIENLVERVVAYKIKSNRPELYLVKPMEGSIYNNEKVRIVFTRKELSKLDFERYLKNPNQNQEKFLIEFSYSKKDAIGRQKTQTQTALMVVNFRPIGSETSKVEQTSRPKKEQEVNKLSQQLSEKKKQFEVLEKEEEKLLSSIKNRHENIIEVKDIVILAIITFLIGFSL